MSIKENIKLFQTINGKFAYDRVKNDIICLSNKVYYSLQEVMKEDKSIDECTKKNIEISKLKKRGYLSNKKIEKIEHSLSKYLPAYLSKRVQSITLQVTQACNFKCRYCGYAGDGYLDRKHSSQNMSIEIGKKAIDFLKEHSCDLDTVKIYFYGGEPLLEYKFVFKCIEYAKTIMPEKNIIFAMSSNLSCLTDEIMKKMVEEKLYTIVSLDGPQNVHDKYRRFAANGKGTYTTVYKKIIDIYQKYPEYFSKYVSINAVIDKEEEIKELEKFFSKKPLNKLHINFTPLDTGKVSMQTSPNESFISEYEGNLFITRFNDLVAHCNDDSRKLIFSSIGDYNEMKKLFRNKSFPSNMHHSGQCIPGQGKLFVNVKGEFATCEKASEKSKMMKLGNVFEGIDFEHAYKILNIGQIIEDECKKCWAIRFCSTCAIFADNYSEFSAELKIHNCEKERQRVLENMKDYAAYNLLFTKGDDNE